MKTIIKVSLFLILLVSKMEAQTSRAGSNGVPVGTFTVNGRIFSSIPDTTTYSDGSRRQTNVMYIRLVSGSFNNVSPNSLVVSNDCIKSVFAYEKSQNKADFLRYFNILRTVFSASRCTTIFNADNSVIGMIGIRSVFKITANGTVEDVYFMVSESTIITPQEIDLLYTSLIAQMSFTTSPSNCSTDARFVFPDKMDFMEQFGVIHTNPYYFGNGSRWTNR